MNNLTTPHIINAKRLAQESLQGDRFFENNYGLLIEKHMYIADLQFKDVLYTLLSGEMFKGTLYWNTDMLAAIYLYNVIIDQHEDLTQSFSTVRLFNEDILRYTNYLATIVDGRQFELEQLMTQENLCDDDLSFILFYINQYCSYFDYRNTNPEVKEIVDTKLAYYEDIVNNTNSYLKTTKHYPKAKYYCQMAIRSFEHTHAFLKDIKR